MKRSRAIVTAWHQYTPFGSEFYQPMFDFYLKNIEQYRDEFDKLYFINSDWKFPSGDFEVIEKERDGHHWTQFKDAIPKIKADKLLFLDDDVIIYRKGVIDNWFKQLDTFDACVEFDGAGGLKHVAWEKFPEMKDKEAEKIGSWYFAVNKELLNKIGDLDMDPHYYSDGEYIKSLDYYAKQGDWTDSFGIFLWQLLDNHAKLYEIEHERSRIYIDGTRTTFETKGKDLGYYHVFSGSAPAYLLATEKYGNIDTYKDYLEHQPKNEYLRQAAWYQYMGGNPERIVLDAGVELVKWEEYMQKFKDYHGLKND